MEELKALAFWDKISSAQRQRLEQHARASFFPAGTLLHDAGMDCTGLFLVRSGQLRVYTLSEQGRELTLYRLFERDLCLLSASCIIRGLQLEVMVAAQEDTQVLYIPSDVYQSLMEEALSVAQYTNELMASHFSDVMWLMDQVMNKKLDARLAALLLEECDLRGSELLPLTHEQLARHLGSAREVLTRMLRHLQDEGLLRLARGSIRLVDLEALRVLAQGSTR